MRTLPTGAVSLAGRLGKQPNYTHINVTKRRTWTDSSTSSISRRKQNIVLKKEKMLLTYKRLPSHHASCPLTCSITQGRVLV